MKKLLILILISSLASFNVYGAWFSNSKNEMTLFGISLGAHQDSSNSKPCYIYKNIYDVKKYGALKVADNRDWKNLIYTDSKIPVAKGCVFPLIDNDDFFNFHIWVYPKTKEIYKIEAIYKKTFVYSDRDLKEKNLYNTECGQLAISLKGIVISSHKEKGFKLKEGRLIKGGTLVKPKYQFDINSRCLLNGDELNLFEIITNLDKNDTKEKNYNPDLKNTYFVKISISNLNSSRIKKEENEIKDELIRENLNKKGL